MGEKRRNKNIPEFSAPQTHQTNPSTNPTRRVDWTSSWVDFTSHCSSSQRSSLADHLGKGMGQNSTTRILWTAGGSHCFNLAGFHFGYLFLTHTHLKGETRRGHVRHVRHRCHTVCCGWTKSISPTLKPWLKPLLVGIYRASNHSTFQGFLGAKWISSIHSRE